MNPNCTPILEKLADFDTPDLSPQEKSVLEKHVSQCPSCKMELIKQRRLLEILRKKAHDRQFNSVPVKIPLKMDSTQENSQKNHFTDFLQSLSLARLLAPFWRKQALVAFCLLFLILSLQHFLQLNSHSEKVFSYISGKVRSFKSHLEFNKGDVLPTEQLLETVTETLFTFPTIRFNLKAQSQFSMSQNIMILNKGKGSFSFEPRSTAFSIKTPSCEIMVVGTAFDVNVLENSTAVFLNQGHLIIIGKKERKEISAGEYIQFLKDGPCSQGFISSETSKMFLGNFPVTYSNLPKNADNSLVPAINTRVLYSPLSIPGTYTVSVCTGPTLSLVTHPFTCSNTSINTLPDTSSNASQENTPGTNSKSDLSTRSISQPISNTSMTNKYGSASIPNNKALPLQEKIGLGESTTSSTLEVASQNSSVSSDSEKPNTCSTASGATNQASSTDNHLSPAETLLKDD
ncbi:MAG: FecR domain-containing protein [Candidatus Riflebacteria bacterium]|nr:FecR domain-containing protein [Candidatus Riflebacteria bacterium]